jgi:hypothetical protein
LTFTHKFDYYRHGEWITQLRPERTVDYNRLLQEPEFVKFEWNFGFITEGISKEYLSGVEHHFTNF